MASPPCGVPVYGLPIAVKPSTVTCLSSLSVIFKVGALYPAALTAFSLFTKPVTDIVVFALLSPYTNSSPAYVAVNNAFSILAVIVNDVTFNSYLLTKLLFKVIFVTFTFLLFPAVLFSNANVPVAVGFSLFTAPVKTILPVADVFPSYVLLSAVAVTVKVRFVIEISFVIIISL